MVKIFISGFVFPNTTAAELLWGTGVSIVIGAVWLIGYWPPLFRKPWLWAVMAFSVILTWIAIAFIQIPLQLWAGQALNYFWNQQTLAQYLLLLVIPQILLSGLVQEGSKLIPVVIWWYRKKRGINPKIGLIIGAVAGAGFGIFEAQWVLNPVFASGMSWQRIQSEGLLAVLPFWGRFFAVAFLTGSSAMAGYGLAKGWGWQFYLVSAFLHSLVNYSVVLLQSGVLTLVQEKVYLSVIAVALTATVLWLRWKK